MLLCLLSVVINKYLLGKILQVLFLMILAYANFSIYWGFLSNHDFKKILSILHFINWSCPIIWSCPFFSIQFFSYSFQCRLMDIFFILCRKMDIYYITQFLKKLFKLSHIWPLCLFKVSLSFLKHLLSGHVTVSRFILFLSCSSHFS